ncbi:MAG: hypothetical protein COA86_04285 [Kangiella sp.]|nr:MAG: hypothetical protein COA86_04285 [Kangiella sp.]
MKYLINSLVVMSLVWLTACGGGPDLDSDDPTPVANVAPTASAANDFSAEENTSVSLDANASSDSDGTITNFAWTQTSGSPSVTINNASTSSASFTTPDISTDTQLTFEVTVTDNDGATNSDSIIITVTPVITANQPPVASVPANFNAIENTNVNLDGSASSDPDGNIASYLWTQTSGSPNVTLSNSDTATATFTAPMVDSDTPLIFQLSVTDDQGDLNSNSVTVTITDASTTNQPPTANAGVDQTVAFNSETTPNMGTNLDGVVDWTSAHPFIDLKKYSREWITACDTGLQADCTGANSWNTGEESSLNLDADGWIISLPTPEESPVYWYTRLFWAGDPQYVGGRHIVTYDGDGTLNYFFGMTLVSSSAGRDVIDITSGDMMMTLTATDPNGTGNYIRNIKIVREVYESVDTDSNPFNPDFLASLSGFQLIRFMDWMATNNSPQTNWSGRSEVNDHTYTTNAGVPIEIQMRLANELAVAPWINIPHQADDNYITQFATTALQELDPNLTIYVEYTNEAWNAIFSQGAYMLVQGRAAWPSSSESDFTISVNWFGQRSANVCDIWKTVWAAQSDRVHCIMGGFAANAWVTEQAMECPLSAFAPCSAHGIDSIAIAPYFAGELGWIDRESEVELWDLTALFSEINNVSVPEALIWVDDHITLANRFNVELTAYEGGQHLVGVNAVVDNDVITSLFNNANRDPRMQQSYETFLTGWNERGGSTFTHFNHISSYSKWGSWGASEYLGQAVTAKSQALLDYLQAYPIGSSTVILRGSGSDPDGTIISYLWEQTAGISVTLVNPSASQAYFDIPTITNTVELRFTLTVTDDIGAIATDEVVITITTSEPPLITGARDDANVFYLGHSLMDNPLPELIAQSATSLGQTNTFDHQNLVGGNLTSQWDMLFNPSGDFRVSLSTGNYDTFVMIEANAVQDHITWSDTYGVALQFYDFAMGSHANMQVYLYEGWQEYTRADWRAELTTDWPHWTGIADSVNSARSGSRPVLMIPGGQALGHLYDAIAAGTADSLTDISEVFEDAVHLNPTGKYYMAMVHYATIYKRSPVGAEPTTLSGWGAGIPEPVDISLALQLQQLAWEVVTDLSARTGVE